MPKRLIDHESAPSVPEYVYSITFSSAQGFVIDGFFCIHQERNADSGDEGGASTDDDESRSTKKRKAPSSSAAPSAISKKVKVAKGAKSEIRAADELADDGEIASKSVGAMSIGSIMGKKRRKGKK